MNKNIKYKHLCRTKALLLGACLTSIICLLGWKPRTHIPRKPDLDLAAPANSEDQRWIDEANAIIECHAVEIVFKR